MRVFGAKALLLSYVWSEGFVLDCLTRSHMLNFPITQFCFVETWRTKQRLVLLTFSFVWCKPYKLVTTLRSLVCAHPKSFVSTTQAGKGNDGQITSKRCNADVDTLSSLQLFNIYLPLEWLFDANQVSKPTSKSCRFPLNLVDIQPQLCCALCISEDTDEALLSSSPVVPL